MDGFVFVDGWLFISLMHWRGLPFLPVLCLVERNHLLVLGERETDQVVYQKDIQHGGWLCRYPLLDSGM